MATRRQKIARKRNWVSFVLSSQLSQINNIMSMLRETSYLTEEEILRLKKLRSDIVDIRDIIKRTNEGDFILKQAEK